MPSVIPISPHGKQGCYRESCRVFSASWALYPLDSFPWYQTRPREREVCNSSSVTPAKTPQLLWCPQLCLPPRHSRSHWVCSQGGETKGLSASAWARQPNAPLILEIPEGSWLLREVVMLLVRVERKQIMLAFVFLKALLAAGHS